MRGKVLLPDKSGLPRKFPAFNRTPRAKAAFGRFAFSAPVQKSGKASFWYRGSPANLGRIAGGMAAVMAAWELYDYVNNLGGDPYLKPGGKLGGGPSAMQKGFVDEPSIAPDVAVLPAPGPGSGWTYKLTSNYLYGLFGDRIWFGAGDHHGRPYPYRSGFYGPRMSNEAGTYTPQQVDAVSFPSFSGGGATRLIRVENRLQSGGRIRDNPVPNWGTAVSVNVTTSKIIWSRTIPWPGALPEFTPVPPFRAKSRSPEDVLAAWPEAAPVPSILPFGDIWKPIPWGMVNAVNLVRGHLGIREEGFLDDLGGPRPHPRPETVHKPVPGRVKEKKGRSNSGRLLLFYRAVRKAWHEADESLEKVDILYDSLPGWVRNRERAKMPHQKIAALLRNWQHIDVSAAVYGLIENEVEDAVIGRGFKSLEDAFEKLGVRGWRGDLAMQYSTDALFDLYGAVKGGL